MTTDAPDPDAQRERFGYLLREAGVTDRRLIDVRDGEKGTRTKGHQQPENWLAPNDPRLSGNYGVHPGRGLIEFDIDDYDGEADTDALDALTETFTVESPHTDENAPGHRYYAVEDDEAVRDVLEEIAGTLNPEPSWGEIKYQGKYVVGPGSQLDDCSKEWCDECAKPDGGYYRIAEDREIATLTAEEIREVLRADPKFSDPERDDDQRKATDVFDLPPEIEDGDPDPDGDGDEWPTEADVREALEHIDPDVGNDKWVRIGYALGGSFDDRTAEQLFTEWSKRGSKWDDEARRRAPDIIDRADPGSGSTDATIATVVELAKRGGWDLSTCPSAEARRAERLKEATTDGGTTAAAPATDPAPDLDGGGDTWPLRPNSVEAFAGLGEDGEIADLTDRQKAACVWDLVRQSNEYHVRVRRDNASLWAYDTEWGVWVPDGERTLRHAARKALGSMNYGANVLAELQAQARADPDAEVEGEEFGLEPGYVAVENGLLDLEAAADGAGDDAIRDLRPDDHALTRLPVEYDPDADPAEWAGYVEEWAEDGRADMLQEYVGYCLEVGAMPIHRALLLVGSGANGKGTFLSVVRALLGSENTTSIELQTLANERDAVADFYGSVANIDDDLSARKLGAGLGMFKKLVAGDPVRARRLYEDGFEFTPTGKHLYAANEVPQVDVPDSDEAFWRRWVLVEFPNHYPKDERNTDLDEELTEADVLSGVLNWAIEGRQRLLEQGYFTREADYAHQKRERWQSWGESVDMFISECVERDPDAERLSTQDAHRRYAAWCRENGEDPVGQRELTNKLKNEDVDYGRHRIDGAVTRGYDALGLTEDVPELEETPDREPDTPAEAERDGSLDDYEAVRDVLEESDGDDADEDQTPRKTAVDSARQPIYETIAELETDVEGAPIADVIDSIPHTPDAALEHIQAMEANDLIERDGDRLRTV